MSHPTVRTMQESAHCIKGRPKGKKEPATRQLLQKMASTYIRPGVSIIVGHMNCDRISPCFLRIFHFNEITQIRCSDLQFSSTDVRIRVPQSKTDQYNDGNEVAIARTGSDTFTVSML